MKKGNLPGHPDRGVDIEKYLNKPADTINELELLAELKNTCGDGLIGDEIQSLTFQVVTIDDKEYALLLVKLLIDNTEDVLAITIQRKKDNVIRYQYSFINEDVPV